MAPGAQVIHQLDGKEKARSRGACVTLAARMPLKLSCEPCELGTETQFNRRDVRWERSKTGGLCATGPQ